MFGNYVKFVISCHGFWLLVCWSWLFSNFNELIGGWYMNGSVGWNMSSEKWCLKDEVSYWNNPFLGDMLFFQRWLFQIDDFHCMLEVLIAGAFFWATVEILDSIPSRWKFVSVCPKSVWHWTTAEYSKLFVAKKSWVNSMEFPGSFNRW